MDFIYKIIPEEIVSAIGWTIFHSLWQGIIVAILLGTFLLLAGKKSARLRYNISVSALFVMLFISLITFTKVYDKPETVSSKGLVVISQVGEVVSSDEAGYSPVFGRTEFNLPEFVKGYFSNHINLIVSVWMIGFIIFSLRFLGGLIYIQRLRSIGLNPIDDSWMLRIQGLGNKMNVKHRVQIFESLQVKVPIAIGYLKPMILLPIGMISNLPYEQVESIIVHELAHIKRYDFVINLFQSFIETIFFYHPLVWFISASINSERENCCDDIAINICGDSLAYSKALYNLQQIQSKESGLALAVIGKTNKLYRRIKRMNTKNYNTAYGIRFAAFALLLIAMAAVSLYSNSSAKSDNRNLASIGFVNPFSSDANNLSQSSIQPTATPDTTSIKKGLRTLKFRDEQNGEEKRFKARLNDGRLESLFIDGEKVDDKDLPNYEGKVAQRADEYDSMMKDYYDNMKNFKNNMRAYREKLKKFSGNRHFHLDFDYPPCPPTVFYENDFDSEEFKDMMEDVQKELHDNLAGISIPPIHIPPVHIPPIHIPKICIPPIDLSELREELKNCQFDTTELRESMKEFKENMKDFKFDMDEFKKQMKENGPGSEAFKESMKNLKKNMNKLKEELKPLKGFLKETKRELVNDNLLEPGDDLDNFKLTQKEMFVDGKKVSPELHKKYLEIYKKHYGKDIKDDFKIDWDD
jgi:bla regulator protein blaR1